MFSQTFQVARHASKQTSYACFIRLGHSKSVLSASPRSLGLSYRFSSAAAALKTVEAANAAATNEKTATGTSVKERFSSLKGALHPSTMKALTVDPFKFEYMSDVQAQVLTHLPQIAEPYQEDAPEGEVSRDLMVRARTGTGKTLAFLVPAIEARLKAIEKAGKHAAHQGGDAARAERVFAREAVGTLILTPTRELAMQVANEAIRLATHHQGFEVRLFIGAMSKRTQMRDFMKGRRDIIVATPGRLRDLLESEPDVKSAFAHCSQLIFDEADTMLDMGFREDISAITKHLPSTPHRQTFMFSATISQGVRSVVADTLAKNHRYIDCVKEEGSPVHAHIPQYHTVLPNAAAQIPHVARLIAHDQLTHPGRSKIMVFLPTTKATQLFTTLLRSFVHSKLPSRPKVFEIHSRRTQEARTRTSEDFKRETGPSILVTSDVSARGVDYPGVTRVIQVGIPPGHDTYIHRVGRTGRSNATGGRGDLVLLPWEIGFLSWQLSDIPFKPLTVTELSTQLAQLAAEPKTVVQSSRQGTRTVSLDTSRLREIDSIQAEFAGQLNPEDIKETFFSFLGYYFAKAAELRVKNNVILEGLKLWTTEGLKLMEPPYVSEQFLQKLGMGDNRTRGFGTIPRQLRDGQMRGGQMHARGDQPHWMGRGSKVSRSKGDRTVQKRAADWTSHHGDSEVAPYRSQRYKHKPGY